MGRTKSKAKAGEAVEAARPYVKRIVEDEELRENLREVYESGKRAYERAAGKRPGDLLEDKKLQKELHEAGDALKAVTEALRKPEKRKSGGHPFAKLLLVAIIGAILALVLSEGLRKAVLDQLFGAEEEFEYTTTTSPPASSSPSA
jgi:hypothetical protein